MQMAAITGVSFVVASGSLGALSLANGDANFVGKVSYSLQPTDNNRGDFEDGNTNLNANNNPINIPQVNVKDDK